MIRARKSLGQHFLRDPSYCARIVEFAAIRGSDTVLEIGPGTGNLTALLIRQARRVIAVEIDPEMILHLQTRFSAVSAGTESRLILIKQDVLNLDWPALAAYLSPPCSDSTSEPIKVIGNLPYNISTRILSRMIERKNRFQSLTFMLQQEVADRVLATSKHGDYGYLSVLMDFHFQRIKGFDVPPGAFQPAPAVVSHVLKLVPRNVPGADSVDYRAFVRLIQSAFRHPRKTLWNNLKSQVTESALLEEAMNRCSLDRNVRPGQVVLDQYLCMTRMLSCVL